MRRCIHLLTGGALSISSPLFFSLSHTHTDLSGPAVLYHHTPPLDHLNGPNPDCRKSSRVHAENGEWGMGGCERERDTGAGGNSGLGVRTEKERDGGEGVDVKLNPEEWFSFMVEQFLQ